MITNKIGDKYIMILKYPISSSSNIKHEIINLAKSHGLIEWFFFRNSRNLFCINLSYLNKSEFIKILNSTTSLSKQEFKKSGFVKLGSSNNFIPVGANLFDTDNLRDEQVYSKSHYKFVNQYFMINPLVRIK